MKKVYILAAVTLALAACDKNKDNPLTSKVEARISASISETVPSRASDTKWGEGDEIGITTTFKGEVGPYINMEYKHQGDGRFTGNTIYIYNPMSIAAYYPFSGEERTAAGILSTATTADKQTPGKQKDFDYLFASIDRVDTDKPDVILEFAHKMSKLTFIFKDGAGTDVSNIDYYAIDKLVLEGTFDTYTGECAATSATAAKELEMGLAEGSVANEKPLPSLIVFPQTLESVKLKIRDKENQYYSCTLDIPGGKLEAGNHYQFTITVSKTALTVNPSITPWTLVEIKDNTPAMSDDDDDSDDSANSQD